MVVSIKHHGKRSNDQMEHRQVLSTGSRNVSIHWRSGRFSWGIKRKSKWFKGILELRECSKEEPTGLDGKAKKVVKGGRRRWRLREL